MSRRWPLRGVWCRAQRPAACRVPAQSGSGERTRPPDRATGLWIHREEQGAGSRSPSGGSSDEQRGARWRWMQAELRYCHQAPAYVRRCSARALLNPSPGWPAAAAAAVTLVFGARARARACCAPDEPLPPRLDPRTAGASLPVSLCAPLIPEAFFVADRRNATNRTPRFPPLLKPEPSQYGPCGIHAAAHCSHRRTQRQAGLTARRCPRCQRVRQAAV